MGKLNSNEKYIFIAQAVSSPSPNIHNLRFYDSGLTYYVHKLYYDETNTYGIWMSPVDARWYIALISANRDYPGSAFRGTTSSSGVLPHQAGIFYGQNGYSGAVRVDLYQTTKNISINRKNNGIGKLLIK